MKINDKSMEMRYVAAIDVGTTKIVTLLGKRNEENNKLEIVDFERLDSDGIKNGEVLNPERASRVVRDTVTQLERRTGQKITDVVVGVVSKNIRILRSRTNIIRENSNSPITASDVERLKKDAGNFAHEQGEEILHILPQGYFVDGKINEIVTDPVGMIGKKLEGNFNVIVAKIDSMDRTRMCIQQTGVEISELVLEPLASSDAVLFPEELETGVALVDIGGGTTDVAVFYDNILRHTAVIPFGGYVITSDIRQECGLTRDVAENLKLAFGKAVSDDSDVNQVVSIASSVEGRPSKEISINTLSKIIQARMDEIIEHVMFHIEASGFADKLNSGIVITGGGSMLKQVVNLFQFRTGKEVRIGYANSHLTGKSEAIRNPNYATGVGLLMKGFEYFDKYGWPEAHGNDSTTEEKTSKEPIGDVSSTITIEQETTDVHTPKPAKRAPFKDVWKRRIIEPLTEFFDDHPATNSKLEEAEMTSVNS